MSKQFPNPFSNMAKRYRLMRSRLPAEVSVIAIGEFKDHFKEQGSGGTKWVKRANDSTDDETRALLIKSGSMRRGMRAAPTGDVARVVNPIPYSGIHNEGGKITGTATIPAYTRRDGVVVKGHNKTMNTTIPARPFMITTVRLTQKIERHIETRIEEVFNAK